MNNHNFQEHYWHMSKSLAKAEEAYLIDEVPVGAVIVDRDGKQVASAHNVKETNNDPCGHAEIIAIRRAAAELKSWRLLNCTIYITLEPCVMCMGAIIHARISHVIFGAYDYKAGAVSLGTTLHNHKKLNHRVSIMGGIEHFKCSRILSQFFREKRNHYKLLRRS